MNTIQKKIIKNSVIENVEHIVRAAKETTKQNGNRLLMRNRTIVSIDYF